MNNLDLLRIRTLINCETWVYNGSCIGSILYRCSEPGIRHRLHLLRLGGTTFKYHTFVTRLQHTNKTHARTPQEQNRESRI